MKSVFTFKTPIFVFWAFETSPESPISSPGFQFCTASFCSLLSHILHYTHRPRTAPSPEPSFSVVYGGVYCLQPFGSSHLREVIQNAGLAPFVMCCSPLLRALRLNSILDFHGQVMFIILTHVAQNVANRPSILRVIHAKCVDVE